MHCAPDEKGEVVFTDSAKGISKMIVDKDGNIPNFPGIMNPDIVAEHLESGKLPNPVVCFQAKFEKSKDGYRMLWQIQPDGQDGDGNAAPNAQEVTLYAYINNLGEFGSGFRIYKADGTKYFGTSLEADAAKELSEKMLTHYILCAIDYFIDMIRKKGPDGMEYNLLDTGKTGVFRFFSSYKGEDKYGFLAGVRKNGSDKLHQHYVLNGYTKEEMLKLLEEEETRQRVLDSMWELLECADRD